MVKTLHAAGIEVILDGLQPHRRGQPSRSYPLLPRHRQRQLLPPRPEDPRFYMDYTGTGNTLNAVTRRCCS